MHLSMNFEASQTDIMLETKLQKLLKVNPSGAMTLQG